MEHSCHKCGKAVEDGLAFCAHCGAPQIRVMTPEPATARVNSDEDASSPTMIGLPNPRSGLGISLPIRWGLALRPCAVAALVGAITMSLGLVLPVAVLGAGLLAVGLYRRRMPGAVIKATTGAQLGAISGIICFALSAIFLAVAAAVSDVGLKLRERMLEGIQQAAARSADPQVQTAMENFKTPQGLAVLLVFSLIVFFLIFVVLGSVGGALGGVFLSRRDRL